MNTSTRLMVIAGFVLALSGACTPLKPQDEKAWATGWKSGSYYAPVQTDI